MPRPVIFIDLAGTLVVRDPVSKSWGAWTGVAGLLHDLAATCDLHLTTGDSHAGARAALADLDVLPLFRGIHADLQGGGKPFGTLAASLDRDPENCLVLGDNPTADTACDTDRVVSIILAHDEALVSVGRVRDVVAALAVEGSFMRGFEVEMARLEVADNPRTAPGRLNPDVLVSSPLGGGCRLGWWQRFRASRRAVVLLSD